MLIGMYPIASYLSRKQIPPPLGGRSEAKGRVLSGFTDSGEKNMFLPVLFFYKSFERIIIVSQRGIPGNSTSLSTSKSTVQDRKSGRPRSSVLPKTAVGNKKFRNAFWVNGKPKCKKGYTYDFRRKMCVLDR